MSQKHGNKIKIEKMLVIFFLQIEKLPPLSNTALPGPRLLENTFPVWEGLVYILRWSAQARTQKTLTASRHALLHSLGPGTPEGGCSTGHGGSAVVTSVC